MYVCMYLCEVKNGRKSEEYVENLKNKVIKTEKFIVKESRTYNVRSTKNI